MGILYHGSSKPLRIIEARPHYLANGEEVVFATPKREVALAFLAPWKDSDLDLGSVNSGPLRIKEEYPGALEKVFKGKKGYIHHVSDKNYQKIPGLWGPELVSCEDTPVLKVEFISDILDELERSPIILQRMKNKVAKRYLLAKTNVSVEELIQIPFSEWPLIWRDVVKDLIKSDVWSLVKSFRASEEDILNWFRHQGFSLEKGEWRLLKNYLRNLR